ncbi:MAG: hypothetical protein LBS36_00655 [Oscillospiraceae bacterium]|jgi:hypothetical protein|nr:hypothetical protein [Oscillospiraceae bacterium]
MTKKTQSVMKGMGAVAAIGGTIAVISSMSGKRGSKRKIKKTAMKAAQTVENVLDGISSVIQ